MIRGCFISCHWNSTFLCCFACWLLFVTLLCSHTVNCHFIDMYFYVGCTLVGLAFFCLCLCCCLYAVSMLGKSNENIKILNQSHSLHRVLYHRNFFFCDGHRTFPQCDTTIFPAKTKTTKKKMRFSFCKP